MINKLLTDHDHIRKTLNLLEMQFLDLCRDKKLNLPLMRSSIIYIQEYPELAHHPLEDMIYSILIEHGANIDVTHNLLSDHTELEMITRELREVFELFMHDDYSKDKLQQKLSIFITRQRQHLYNEELVIYPLAQHILTKEDWDKVEAVTPYRDNPIFGTRTQDDYEILRREIEATNEIIS